MKENNSNNEALEPKKVNHGNVFGNGNWYTFHCPKCSTTLQGEDKCEWCKQKIKW